MLGLLLSHAYLQRTNQQHCILHLMSSFKQKLYKNACQNSSPSSQVKVSTRCTCASPSLILMIFLLSRVPYVSYHTASDKCQQEKRKTINGDDLLWAMSTLGFDKYVEPLKLYLAKYREVRCNFLVLQFPVGPPLTLRMNDVKRPQLHSFHVGYLHHM